MFNPIKKALSLLFAFSLFAGTVPASVRERKRSTPTGPALLTFVELEELGRGGPEIPAPHKAKTDALFSTPFVENAFPAPAKPAKGEALGPFMRMAEWNIERGINFEMILSALSGPDAFDRFIDEKKFPRASDKRRVLLEQAEYLKAADVLALIEVDYGMKRSDYRYVARELAQALKMNFAYGVEFLEVDPLQLGTEKFEQFPEEVRSRFTNEIAVDQSRYLGMHGTAILSRYPIRNARILPLPVVHDWYSHEKNDISPIEKGKREAIQKVFLETVQREVRRGGRMALLVDLDLPFLTEKTVTVVATHLENRTDPKGRRAQMKELLKQIAAISNPVILAGDFNTTMGDGTPTTVRREIYKRIKSPAFWVKNALGVGMFTNALISGANYFKNHNDPTMRNVPLVAPNPESGLFDELEDMRFADGMAWDFRGDRTRALDDKKGTLANSNQRGGKGFRPTFETERSFASLAGEFKLDWFFVKSFARKPRDEKASYRFSPHFGRTLSELNEPGEDRISDHCPITIDLPFEEPGR
jgi:endonuclease/exonuclease/phosphatase family metal-dependent hydrolase